MVTVSLQFTPEEIVILNMALDCYNHEIANEEDSDYQVLLNLKEKLRKELQ